MTVLEIDLRYIDATTREEVSGNESASFSRPRGFAPAVLMPDAAALRSAELLPLELVPHGDEARALVSVVAATLAPYDAASRKTKRRAVGEAKRVAAVGAIVGGLLRKWSSETPRLAFRSLTAESFTEALIGVRQFRPAMVAAMEAGLVGRHRGISYEATFGPGDPKHSKRRSARYWPTDALLSLAEQHGVFPQDVRSAFRIVAPTKPPAVPNLLKLRSLDTNAPIAPSPDDPVAAALRADVEAHNAMAAAWEVSGCCPPRWCRIFHGDWRLTGRWHAVGSAAVYQNLPKVDRAAITMNGEAVVELDIRAAQFSLLCALARRPLPLEDDPYDVPGIPRERVKRWIVATLGKGSPVVRAPRGTASEWRTYRAPDVAEAVVAKHPILKRPWRFVPKELVEAHGDPRRVLPYWLTGIEATAMTEAMRTLREREGVLSLPVHDSLIVPASRAEVAVAVIVESFERVAGFRPWVEG